MPCQHCIDADKFFSGKVAQRDWKKYQKKGPAKPTRFLLEELERRGVTGLSLLDIGGGVGEVQLELLKRGIATITNVDASSGYQQMVKEEAKRSGHASRFDFRFGDYTDLADTVHPHDIVTLDKVICCFPDMKRLVSSSAKKARKYYGIVVPNRNSFLLFVRPFFVLFMKMRGSSFRFYLHPVSEIEKAVEAEGLKKIFDKSTFTWRTILFEQ